MNREQMVEKAAQVLREKAPTAPPHWSVRTTRAILDAILPQVTTVAELEALPALSSVVGSDGQPWWRIGKAWGGWGQISEESSEWLLSNCGPTLTVVWKPEVTQ